MNWYKIAQEAWEMTGSDFLEKHRSGYIPEDAYDKYKTREGIDWLSEKDKNPVVHSRGIFGGVEIEFRQSGEKNKYVRTDENGEVVRDENDDNALYLTDEEVAERGLATHDTTITAYDASGAVGWVANSFGVPEVIVIDEMQGKGIGTYLLAEWMKFRKPTQTLGQMTPAGEKLTNSYHRQLVQQALAEGKPVPPQVLANYPGLQGQITPH